MPERYDDLDAYIAKRAVRNPEFPAMVDAALKERRLLRELATRRVEMGLSQKTVAALMGTTQPALARLERGEIDPKLSTLERYAEALGQSIAVIADTDTERAHYGK
jgi:transcriptional regulator with XRE-family HTH domain